MLRFSQAVELMKKGRKVCRAGWYGWQLEIETPEKGGDMVIIYSNYSKTFKEKWKPTQEDILADDWMLISEKDKTKGIKINVCPGCLGTGLKNL